MYNFKGGNSMKKAQENRKFIIPSIDCTSVVEFDTRKNLLDYLDCFIENLQQGFKPEEYYDMLYDDGTEDRIDQEYDGHKIRRQHIVSMVYNNEMTSCVYGNFEINEWGSVYPAIQTIISEKLREVTVQ